MTPAPSGDFASPEQRAAIDARREAILAAGRAVARVRTSGGSREEEAAADAELVRLQREDCDWFCATFGFKRA